MPADFLSVLKAFQDAGESPFADVAVRQCGHLMQIERAAGRPKDLDDVKRLSELPRYLS